MDKSAIVNNWTELWRAIRPHLDGYYTPEEQAASPSPAQDAINQWLGKVANDATIEATTVDGSVVLNSARFTTSLDYPFTLEQFEGFVKHLQAVELGA